jgi:hypothetical protein
MAVQKERPRVKPTVQYLQDRRDGFNAIARGVIGTKLTRESAIDWTN